MPAAKGQIMHIIDIHAHIYPDSIAAKATRAIGAFYQIPMSSTGTADTLLKWGEEAGIALHVIHSAAVTGEQVPVINRFISSQVSLKPNNFIGFGTLHIDYEYMEEELTKIKSMGLRGIKMHPDFQHIYPDDSACLRLLHRMAGHNLPLLVHTGDSRYAYSAPERIARVADTIPNLQIICAHLGGWSVWEEGYKVLQPYKNIWLDTSSSLYALTAEKAADIIRQYGVDRIFFGTDYPMWHPVEEVRRFLALPLSETEKMMILSENFTRFMGSAIPAKPG
ncbi:MAG: amidohydrolase family protein [Clostridia bacterium]|nr:amidohydrolase family protein [Clostridia bacterium]